MLTVIHTSPNAEQNKGYHTTHRHAAEVMPAPAREEEDTKAAVRPLFITLKVLDREDRRIRHTIRLTDELQAVMDMYYAKAPDVTYGTGTFLSDGSIWLKGWKTLADLELVDGEEIDFFPEQLGGGWDYASV